MVMVTDGERVGVFGICRVLIGLREILRYGFAQIFVSVLLMSLSTNGRQQRARYVIWRLFCGQLGARNVHHFVN